jgi:hypothetical protein
MGAIVAVDMAALFQIHREHGRFYRILHTSPTRKRASEGRNSPNYRSMSAFAFDSPTRKRGAMDDEIPLADWYFRRHPQTYSLAYASGYQNASPVVPEIW